jgi:hypothetical protein
VRLFGETVADPVGGLERSKLVYGIEERLVERGELLVLVLLGGTVSGAFARSRRVLGQSAPEPV